MEPLPPEEERPESSPWPAVFLAIVGGALAVLSIKFEHPALDFAAAGCFVISLLLTRRGVPEADGNPMAKESTRGLLLVFAILTAGIGVLRLMRG